MSYPPRELHTGRVPHLGERVVAAAVQHYTTKLVFSLPIPSRHSDILHAMYGLGLSTTHSDNLQGFLLDSGQFVDRVEARAIALAAGQAVDQSSIHATELFSEDLW